VLNFGGTIMSNVKPTDYLVSINKKNYIFDKDEDYIPYLVNRWLSIHQDLLFHVNEINMNPHLPRRMQYDYFFYGTPARTRFLKWSWPKRQTDELTAYVMQKYKYSATKAKAALAVLTDDQIKALTLEQQEQQKGGIYDRNISGGEN
jgi:hypothetical protein